MCSKLYEFNKYKISNDNNELISKKTNYLISEISSAFPKKKNKPIFLN